MEILLIDLKQFYYILIVSKWVSTFLIIICYQQIIKCLTFLNKNWAYILIILVNYIRIHVDK